MHTWKTCYHSNQKESMVNLQNSNEYTDVSVKHLCRNLLFPPYSLGKGKHIEESYGFCSGISPSQPLAFVSVASLQM